MIIQVQPNSGCEIHFVGTHDVVWIRHQGDHVEAREFITTHGNDEGFLFFKEKLNPVGEKLHPDSETLTLFEASMLMTQFGANVSWIGRDVVVDYKTNRFSETARDDTPEAKADAFCAVMTVVGMINGYVRHSSRG